MNMYLKKEPQAVPLQFEAKNKDPQSFGDWVSEGALNTIRDKTVGSMTGLLFDYSPLSLVAKGVFRSIFPKPTPGYMIALENIQNKLEEMDAKLNTLISYSQEILQEINKTYNFIVKDTIVSELHSKNSVPYQVNTKYQALAKLEAFNRNYTVDELWDYASGTCQENTDGSLSCSLAEQYLIMELGGLPPGQESPYTGTSIQELYNTLMYSLQDPELQFSDLNKNFQTYLGVQYTNGELTGVKAPSEAQDLTVPWNAVNTALNKLTVAYYNSLSELYYMQALQLAFYFARNDLFRDGFIIADTSWLKGTDPEAGTKEGFAIALENMTKSFTIGDSGLGYEIQKIFGSTTGNSVVKNHIPDLKDYIQFAINNQHTFPDALLENCAIKSVYMPVVGGENKNHYLGRIEMVALTNEDDVIQQITVGHDIPYASLPFSSATTIGNTGIDGFEFIDDGADSRLDAIKYSLSNYNDWVPDYEVEKESVPIVMGWWANGWGVHQWAYYQGYEVYIQENMDLAHEWIYNYASSKSDNPWGRNSKGTTYDSSKENYSQYISYGKNRSNDWFGKPHETRKWNQSYIVRLKKTGNLFILVNEFPAQKNSVGASSFYYTQFIKPVPFQYVTSDIAKQEDLGLVDPNQIHLGYWEAIQEHDVYKQNDIDAINCKNGIKVTVDVDLTTTNKWPGGWPDSKNSTVKSRIELNLSNVPENYLFAAGPEYTSWINQSHTQPEATVYLSGNLFFQRSNTTDTTVMKSNSGLYVLVFTKDGTLEIQATDSENKLVLSSRKNDTLSFANGDVWLGETGLISLAYEEQNSKPRWVIDPFACMTLSDEGVLDITSSAKPTLGDGGTIWSSEWTTDSWPEFHN